MFQMALFEISSFGVEIILNFQYKFSALEKKGKLLFLIGF